jgi:serine kinase of HPr protein (carbohydrate metabolism regulator)
LTGAPNVDAPNLHATGLVLGVRGLLITGASGSGKTSLALALIHRWRADGRFAVLIADDQVNLHPRHGRLIARAPAPIAGLIELHGLGPRPAEHSGSAVVDGVCRLVPAADAPRTQAMETETLNGIAVPRIDLPARSNVMIPALAAWLDEIVSR